jgi:hypothetical protein
LGGLKGEADAANSGYFAVRGLLAKSVAEAARFIIDRGVLAEGGTVLVRLLAQIASRFGIVVITQRLKPRWLTSKEKPNALISVRPPGPYGTKNLRRFTTPWVVIARSL